MLIKHLGCCNNNLVHVQLSLKGKSRQKFDMTLFFYCFQIHWFSIFNSFMMVIFLVGLVSMILMRTLRKDYARYSKDDELDDMVKYE